MKTPAFRRRSGFTLVELLVVIAIIAVLAAAGFAAGNAAINKARKVTALAAATAIEQAVNNFFEEYKAMPKEISADETTNTKTDLKVLNELLGISNPTINTRAIKFLAAKEGKANKGGLIYDKTGSSVQGLYDPWGGPFYLALDGDYDERVKPEPSAGGGKVLNGRRVAVWSNGADGVNKGGNPADDVVTW